MTNFYMIRLIRKQKKIFQSIIRFIMINMMNYFLRFKKSLQLLFNNKPMFLNIPLITSIGMVWTPNIFISMTIISYTSFPLRVKLSHSLRTAVSRTIYSTPTFWTRELSITHSTNYDSIFRFISTFPRTISSFIRRKSAELNITKFACIYH